MASDTLAELLGLNPATSSPNAYQLFGLKDGENDPQVITAAINRTLRRLKASQESSDPIAWKQAAAAVTKARRILTDADAKAQYDAKRYDAKRSRRPRGEAIDDPLQGLLPQYDPLAAFDLSAAAERLVSLRPPQPTVPAAAGAAPDAPPPSVAERAKSFDPLPHAVARPSPTADVAASPSPVLPSGESGGSGFEAPVVDAPLASSAAARRRRRRGFPWAATILTVLVIGMLGGIGVGVYLLTVRERQIAGADTATPPVANEPMPELPQVPVDPVMSSAVAEAEATARNFLSADEIAASREPPVEGSPAMPAPSETTTPSVPMTESVDEPKPPAVTPSEPAGAVVQAGQDAIDAAKQAILDNDWTEMKASAARAVEAAADEEQKAVAQRLLQLADLADYYYTGLIQSLETLEAGNQMELENVGTVGVVEANQSTFAIQVKGRPKSFEFDKIPFFIVDAIAKQSMDLSDPTTQAAKAVHQAISTNATPEHRLQALDWLAELPDTLQGAEPDALQQAIHELYPNL